MLPVLSVTDGSHRVLSLNSPRTRGERVSLDENRYDMYCESLPSAFYPTFGCIICQRVNQHWNHMNANKLVRYLVVRLFAQRSCGS